MPYKDPARERERQRSPKRRAYGAKRDRYLRKLARTIRRVLRSMAPERYRAVRALLTVDEAEAFDALALEPVVPGGMQRVRR